MAKDTYIVIQSWMVEDLHLKGNSLLIYAIIHGFTQNVKEQRFTGSLQYLADWTQSTKRGVMKTLQGLVDAKLINKEEVFIGGVKYCAYNTVKPEGECGTEFTTMELSSPGYGTEFTGVVNKVHRGMELSSPNNINNNIDNTIEENKNIIGSTLSEARDAVPSTADRTPYAEVMKLYNSICTSFPSIKVLSNDRKNHIKARFAQGYTLDDFREVFNNVQASAWLKTWTGCTFDWIIKDRSMPKILEGKYRDRDDNDSVSHNASDPVRIDFQRYRDADGEFSVSFETLGNGRKKMTMSYDSGLTKVLEYDNDTRPTWLQ